MDDIKKSCKGCVFATIYKTGQVGCELNRLEPFKENGATIELNTDEGYHVINGRYCSTYRPQGWAKHKDKWRLPLIVRAETLTTFEVLIYIGPDDKEPFDRLILTLANLHNQLLKPSNIVVIVNQDEVAYAKFMKILSKHSTIPYRLDKILRSERNERIDMEDALDITVRKCTTDYYTVMYAGHTIPDTEFFANIDEAINVKMKRFSVLLPTLSWPIVFGTEIHKKLQGNVPIRAKTIDESCEDENLILNYLIEKIHYLAKKDNQQFMIQEYKDLIC